MTAHETLELKIPKKRQILLWGGKSKARLIEEMINEATLGEVGVIFDYSNEQTRPVVDPRMVHDISNLKPLLPKITHFVVCIGAEHGYARFKTSEYLENVCGLIPLSIAHKKSYVEPTASIGIGCQLMPFAVVHKFATVGRYCVINTNATVDHECSIGNGVHVMGNAAIAGRVTIGDYASIGTNATILPDVEIGEGAFVGAGAVVTKNVEPYSVVAGVPAKFVRRHQPDFMGDILLRLAP